VFPTRGACPSRRGVAVRDVPGGARASGVDDAIHANIGPAMLEKGAGNQFTARVFPIPASGDKELAVA
jgi:hypothetical protein